MNGFNLSQISDLYVGSTQYSAIYLGSGLIWERQKDYSREYLTFESLEDNNVIGFKAYDSSLLRTIQVSTDKTNWTSYTSSTGGTTLATLNTGDKLYIKGSNSYYAISSINYNYFTSSGQFNVYGNIISLIYGDNFIGQTTLTDSYTFSYLFKDNKIVDASNLILPATTLANYCYNYMFRGCTSLTTAPVLPATTLANYCYNYMFRGCTSLTTAPVLPATTLATYCYQYMFYGCTSLTTAPVLPATTLATYCYYGMFQGCTSLITAPELPATTLATYCYNSMFSGCTSLTTAPVLPATTLATYCYNSMFYGCTSLTTAPVLPATTLTNSCYIYMFYGCTSLTTAPVLPATTLTTQCYYGMFQNCTSLTTAPVLPATTLATYCYNSMFRDCSSLNYIKMLATDISASNCLNNWVSGVASTGTFVKNPNATWTTTGVSGVPTGWTVQYYDPTVFSNASIKVYDNYNTGTANNAIHELRAGTDIITGTSGTWYYGKNRYIRAYINGQKVSLSKTYKLNVVITGLSEFKVALKGSSNVCSCLLEKLNDNSDISYNDFSASNTHTQVYSSGDVTEYTYTNLDPNTKYNIVFYLRANATNTSLLIVPQTYPLPEIIKNTYFTSSSDYTEIYG